MSSELAAAIEAAWDARDSLNTTSRGAGRDAVEAALSALDDGSLRVAEKSQGVRGQRYIRIAAAPVGEAAARVLIPEQPPIARQQVLQGARAQRLVPKPGLLERL